MEELSVTTAEVAEQSSVTEEVAPQKQSAEENAKFAAARRKAEAEAEKKISALEQSLKEKFKPAEDILNTLKELGVGEKDMITALKAAKSGRTVEEQIRIENERAELLKNSPEIAEANRIRMENLFREHLEQIKEAYPEVTAKHVSELGEEYLKLMKGGFSDPVAAYEAQLALNRRKEKTPPPSTGDVKSSGSASEKDFYSPEEVDRLTDKQLDDPKILDRVIKSMSKWR